MESSLQSTMKTTRGSHLFPLCSRQRRTKNVFNSAICALFVQNTVRYQWKKLTSISRACSDSVSTNSVVLLCRNLSGQTAIVPNWSSGDLTDCCQPEAPLEIAINKINYCMDEAEILEHPLVPLRCSATTPHDPVAWHSHVSRHDGQHQQPGPRAAQQPVGNIPPPVSSSRTPGAEAVGESGNRD